MPMGGEVLPMKTVLDPRGREAAPLLHFVAELSDSPGGHEVLTSCGQRFVAQTVQDSDLGPETLSQLCLQCAYVAHVRMAI